MLALPVRWLAIKLIQYYTAVSGTVSLFSCFCCFSCFCDRHDRQTGDKSSRQPGSKKVSPRFQCDHCGQLQSTRCFLLIHTADLRQPVVFLACALPSYWYLLTLGCMLQSCFAGSRLWARSLLSQARYPPRSWIACSRVIRSCSMSADSAADALAEEVSRYTTPPLQYNCWQIPLQRWLTYIG